MKIGVCLVLAIAASACGASRTTFARYPGAPAAFDPAGSDAKAVALAQKVFEAAGGPGNWDKAHQIKWQQQITQDGKPIAWTEEAWDRWNARHWGRLKNGEKFVGASWSIYGDTTMAYLESANGYRAPLGTDEKAQAVDVAKKAFHVDTAVLCMQFIMLDPGTKLADKGASKEGDVEYQEIEVSFADPARAGVSFQVYIDPASSTIHRIDYTSGTGAHFAYNLSAWTAVGGLKFAGKRENAGVSETIAISEITITEPDERLFIAQVQ